MSSFFSPFSRSRAGNAWFRIGLESSLPDITGEDGAQIRDSHPLCAGKDERTRGCRVFYVPKEDSSKATEVDLGDTRAPPEAGGLRDQVLVFKYKGKVHAINHVGDGFLLT